MSDTGGLLSDRASVTVNTTNVNLMRESKMNPPGGIRGLKGVEEVEQGQGPGGYQRLKLVKRGYRETTVERVCGLSFEGFPVLIWSFRLSDWSKIYITDTDERRLRQYHVSTWSYAKDKLVIIFAGDIVSLVGVDVWFVSGSMVFIESSCIVTSAFPQVV